MSKLTQRGGPGASDGAQLRAGMPVVYPNGAPGPVTSPRNLSHAAPLTSKLSTAGALRKVWSAVVSRVPDRTGDVRVYVHGAEAVQVPNYGGPSAGTGAIPPSSSAGQPLLIGPIANAALNGFLYRAGVPLGIGRPGRAAPYNTIRVAALPAALTANGAPTSVRPNPPRPQYRKVQTVPRARTAPRRYATTSARS